MMKCFTKCFEKTDKYSQDTVKTSSYIMSEAQKVKPQSPNLLDITLSTSSSSDLLSILEKSIIFRKVPEAALQDIIKKFKLMVIEKNKEIQKQDMKLSALYTLSKGEASCLHNGRYLGPCSNSGFISELDFLYDTPRRISVKTNTACSIWTISRNYCKKFFADIHPLSAEKLKLALSKSIFLKGFPDLVKIEILKIAYPLEFYENELIISKSYESGYFFIISSGKVELKYESCVEVIGPGEIFGDLTFIMSQSDGVVARALGEVEVFVVRTEAFKQLAGSDYVSKIFKKILFDIMTSDEYTHDIPIVLMKKLVDSFKISEVPQGKVAIANSKVLSKKLVILIHGSIASATNCFKDQQLFGFFNENHLKLGTGKYICQRNSIIAEISSSDMGKITGCSYETYIKEVALQVELRKVPFFRLIEKNHITSLIKKAKLKKFNKGDWIYKEGEPAVSVYYVTNGSVGIYEGDDFLFRFDTGGTFGETCLKINQRENSAQALTLLVCYEFPKSELSEAMNEFLSDFINKSIYYFSKLDYKDVIIQPPITNIKSRGYCVSTTTLSTCKYFVEMINKSKVKDTDSFLLIIDQKCALIQVSHPSMLRFIRTVSSPTHILFIYEHLEFTTLDWFMNSSLEANLSKFIICSLCNTLSYLHSKDILHRDICPSSIALDPFGWIKLVSFKYIKQCKERSYTLLNTSAAYKAKETLEGSGYLKASESWSLGVMLFEMLTGTLPFGIESKDNPVEMSGKVINGKLEVPESVSIEDKDMILMLMNEDYKKRINCCEVLKMPWANGYKVFDGNNGMIKSPLKNLKKGQMYVNCTKLSTSKLSRINTNITKISDACDELKWDEYF